ncbi:hypothetical protein IP84_06885 [beta proteobacterium AAP99]|nr:hypothetical protein IP84_06885 [beta proteobacterium AAP99]
MEYLRVIQEDAGQTGTLYVYVIEGALWAVLSDDRSSAADMVPAAASAPRLSLQAHVPAPEAGAQTLLLTEATLAALVNGQLTISQALALGVARLKRR